MWPPWALLGAWRAPERPWLLVTAAAACRPGAGAYVGPEGYAEWLSLVSPTMMVTVEVAVVLSERHGVEQAGLSWHHEWQVPQGGPGRLPGPAEGGD